MKTTICIMVSFLWCMGISAQHIERNLPETDGHANHKPDEHHNLDEVHSLKEFFSKGHFGGHVRYNFMATDNQGGLTDFYAHAMGTMLEFHTPILKGFQIGTVSLFTYNLWSSDFEKATSACIVPYEMELFDMQDPENRADMDRVDELYLKYYFGQSYLMAGRIGIQSPLINMADQRMKPYVVQGFWTEINEIKNVEIHFGWLDHISSRGTVEWERLSESIGLFPQGVTAEGHHAHYHEHIHTKGIGLGGIQISPLPHFTISVWDYWLQNQMNTMLSEASILVPIGNWKLETGVQGMLQQGMGEREGLSLGEIYIGKYHESQLWGAKLGVGNDKLNVSLNYLQIGNQGAFIFPRELGKPQLYASLNRERFEGMGNFKAITLKGKIRFNKHLSSQVDIARTFAPSLHDYALNKYQDVSKEQVNIDLQYDFSGSLDGLSIDVFYAYKHATESIQIESPLYYHANLHHVNLVANINF